ncbi:hypothetical protein [Caballeronia sp. SBC2]|uniref:hypothetical protein n=1 Tax=Caballeronia sp. SBC2 TaxID=2705547 RepID=UPI0013EBF897|nr:hypothetical protein [Caballeronia sp. SBC2]
MITRSETLDRPFGGTRAPACGKRHKASSSHAIVMPGTPVWQSRRGVRPPSRTPAAGEEEAEEQAL